jgi:hypothetical protein
MSQTLLIQYKLFYVRDFPISNILKHPSCIFRSRRSFRTEYNAAGLRCGGQCVSQIHAELHFKTCHKLLPLHQSLLINEILSYTEILLYIANRITHFTRTALHDSRQRSDYYSKFEWADVSMFKFHVLLSSWAFRSPHSTRFRSGKCGAFYPSTYGCMIVNFCCVSSCTFMLIIVQILVIEQVFINCVRCV